MSDELKDQTGPATATTVEAEGSALDRILGGTTWVADDKPAVLEIMDVYIQQIAQTKEGALPKIDKALFESRIAYLDDLLSKQLDLIIHNEQFQKVESAWRSLDFLVNRTNWQQKNVNIQLLNVSKDELEKDFNNDITQTGLYKHLYHSEYDQLGGSPISVMVSNYEFDNTPEQMELLGNIARVAAAVHCPFIGSVGAQFFGREKIDDLEKLADLDVLFDGKKYTKWNSFRERNESRFVGLTFPRFLLRAPYEATKKRSFVYKEDVASSKDSNKYLWGNASFAVASNMIAAFQKYGWAVQIRGPKAGGMVENLPLHYNEETGDTKMPTEMLIPDHRELLYSKYGFIPFINEKGKDRACFYSANSAQKAKIYDDPEATATSKAMTRLPYILLASRIAHYLKVQQRDNIGANKPRSEIEKELNDWINTLVSKMDRPDPDMVSKRPLRDAKVVVTAIPDDPGWYDVSMMIVPHFSSEGLKVRLALMAQMPAKKK